MDKTTLISIITPSFNSEKYIAICIDSVISQTYLNWELLIVDGESNDSTAEIVSRYAEKDKRVMLINNPNDDGPAQARALGLKIANGDYVAFIDSDDIWLPNKLDKQLSFMSLNGYFFTFTSYRKMRPDGRLMQASIGGHSSNNYRQYLRRRGIANSTVMLRRECVTLEVLCTVGKSHGEDTLWWLLIMRNGYDAFALQEPLTIYRMVEGSLSTKVMNNQRTIWHSYRNELGLKLLDASFCYVFYLIDVALRRFKFLVRSS